MSRIGRASAEQIHADISRDLAAAAERIPPEKWLAPRAAGKWSPAEVVEHLTLVYDVLLAELAGGPGMQIRTKWWQRLLLQFTLVPRLLRGEPFPAGARAPRETRPVLCTTDQREAIASFRERAARFSAAVAAAGGNVRLTHAYFGRAPVAESVLLCARHMQHHRKQLTG